MTTVTISLPESLREFIATQVKTKGYGNVSEYFRGLLREAQEREADKRLETLLLESLDDLGALGGEAARREVDLVDQYRRDRDEEPGLRQGEQALHPRGPRDAQGGSALTLGRCSARRAPRSGWCPRGTGQIGRAHV